MNIVIEEIYRRVGLVVASQHLRTAKTERACKLRHCLLPWSRKHQAGEAEVDKNVFAKGRRKHDVLWLDVNMNYTQKVECPQLLL